MEQRLLSRPMFDGASSPPYVSHEIHTGVFTPRQCGRIVDAGLALESAAACLEGEGGASIDHEEIRRSRTAWLPPDEEHWWVYEKLVKVVERANRRYRFDLWGFGEDLQFTTYQSPGDFYSWHQDGLDGTLSVRKLSVVVQLSDPALYEGGELQIFDVAEDADRDDLDAFHAAASAQGSAVVFPSFEYHRVLPMRAGVRHSLVAWLSGPPFR